MSLRRRRASRWSDRGRDFRLHLRICRNQKYRSPSLEFTSRGSRDVAGYSGFVLIESLTMTEDASSTVAEGARGGPVPGGERPAQDEVPEYHDPVDASTYSAALDAKVAELERLFSPLMQQASIPILNAKGVDRSVSVRPEVFPSPPLNFRSRCRFQVMWEDGLVTAESTGISPGESVEPGRRLSYRMWNKGKPTAPITEFPMALREIEELMPAVLREAEADPELGNGLQAIHFLASRGIHGGMVVTMVYGRPIDEAWKMAAEGPRARLKAAMRDIRERVYGGGDDDGFDGLAGPRGDDEEFDATTLNILGRSRGTQIVVGDACHVFETLTLRDGRRLSYRQVEGAFSNPNSFMAESTLDWLCDCAATTVREALSGTSEHSAEAAPPSLLELYSGNGNHTVGLAKYFDSVATVELSGVLCEAARENLARNGVENAKVLHSPSESVARGMLRRKKRHEEGRVGKAAMAAAATGAGDGSKRGDGSGMDFDINAYDVVLVDPPRAGLDPDTLDLVSRFDVVLYISCDPRKGLLENAVGPRAARALDTGEFEGEFKGWSGLARTHDLVRFAVFDHFPYTRHIECGACFVRRR